MDHSLHINLDTVFQTCLTDSWYWNHTNEGCYWMAVEHTPVISLKAVTIKTFYTSSHAGWAIVQQVFCCCDGRTPNRLNNELVIDKELYFHDSPWVIIFVCIFLVKRAPGSTRLL